MGRDLNGSEMGGGEGASERLRWAGLLVECRQLDCLCWLEMILLVGSNGQEGWTRASYLDGGLLVNYYVETRARFLLPN